MVVFIDYWRLMRVARQIESANLFGIRATDGKGDRFCDRLEADLTQYECLSEHAPRRYHR